MSMSESPIFITGLPRTGKTPLRVALGSHPRLCLTRKTRMWTRFYGRFGDLNDPASLERCLEAMFSDPGSARLLPDSSEIRREFATRPRTYPELFGVLHEQYARRLGKTRWGEQAGFLEQYADPIFSTWRGARMIHMVRHPSDWIPPASQRRPGGVGRELREWSLSAELALYNRSLYGERYMIVLYERLLSEPIPTLQEITSFIGEETNFGMGQSLLAALPEKAESKLVPGARSYVEEVAGPLVTALGYGDSGGEPPNTGLTRAIARVWFGRGKVGFAGSRSGFQGS